MLQVPYPQYVYDTLSGSPLPAITDEVEAARVALQFGAADQHLDRIIAKLRQIEALFDQGAIEAISIREYFRDTRSRIVRVFASCMDWFDRNPGEIIGIHTHSELFGSYKGMGARVDFSQYPRKLFELGLFQETQEKHFAPKPVAWHLLEKLKKDRAIMIFRNDSSPASTVQTLMGDPFPNIQSAEEAAWFIRNHEILSDQLDLILDLLQQAEAVFEHLGKNDVAVETYFPERESSGARVFMACMDWIAADPRRIIGPHSYGEIYGSYEGLGGRSRFPEHMKNIFEKGLFLSTNGCFAPHPTAWFLFARMKAEEWAACTPMTSDHRDGA